MGDTENSRSADSLRNRSTARGPSNTATVWAMLIQCGKCQKQFKAQESLAGKRVKCPQCGQVIQVPVAARPAQATSSQEAQFRPEPHPDPSGVQPLSNWLDDELRGPVDQSMPDVPSATAGDSPLFPKDFRLPEEEAEPRPDSEAASLKTGWGWQHWIWAGGLLVAIDCVAPFIFSAKWVMHLCFATALVGGRLIFGSVLSRIRVECERPLGSFLEFLFTPWVDVANRRTNPRELPLSVPILGLAMLLPIIPALSLLGAISVPGIAAIPSHKPNVASAPPERSVLAPVLSTSDPQSPQSIDPSHGVTDRTGHSEGPVPFAPPQSSPQVPKPSATSRAATPWTYTPDPAETGESATHQIPLLLLENPHTILQMRFSPAGSGRLVVLSTPGRTAFTPLLADSAYQISQYDLRTGKQVGLFPVQGPCAVADVSPDGSRVLLTDSTSAQIWLLDSGKMVHEWVVSDDNQRSNAEIWAQFIDDEHLLTLDPTNRLVAWTLPQVTRSFLLENVESAALSPSRQFAVAAVSTSKQSQLAHCWLFDTRTGSARGRLETPAEHRTGMRVTQFAFRRNGLRLGAVAGGELIVWDLQDGSLFSTAPIPVASTNIEFDYVGNDLLRVGDALVDDRRGAVVWHFTFQPDGPQLRDRVQGSPDGRSWIALAGNDLVSTDCFLFPLPLPDPDKLPQEPAQPVERGPAFEQGAKVSLDVQVPDNPTRPGFARRVTDRIKQLLAVGQHDVEEGQPFKVVAEVTARPTGRQRQFLSKVFGKEVQSQTITVTEDVFDVRVALLDQRGKTVWENHTEIQPSEPTSGMPKKLRPGETIETAAQNWFTLSQWNQIEEFFSTGLIVLPPSISRRVEFDGQPINAGTTGVSVAGLFPDAVAAAARRPIRPSVPNGSSVPGTPRTVVKPCDNSRNEEIHYDRQFEKASEQQARDLYLDLITGDGQTLVDRMRWLPALNRPSIAVRWALGVQIVGGPSPISVRSLADLDSVTGPIGEGLLKALRQRASAGKFGEWPKASDKKLNDVRLLPSGRQAELQDAARRQALDLLVLVDLNNEIVGFSKRWRTTAKIKIIDAFSGLLLWTSEPLNDTQVALALRNGSKDPRVLLVKDATDKIDLDYQLDKMPELSADRVAGRLEELGKQSAENPWNALVELRYYEVKKLAAPAALSRLYDKILGPGGEQKISEGSVAERRAAVQSLLDKQ